jgi:hypothetical protein
LDRQVFCDGSRNLGSAFQDRFGFREQVNQHARADAGQIVQTVAHGGHDAKVAAAAAAQGPEQLLFMVVAHDDGAAIREDDLCGEQIVEGEAEATDQGTVTAAQGETRHADGAERPRYRHDAEGVGRPENVCGAGASRNPRGPSVGTNCHAVHGAQVDDDAVAQRPTRPVVAAAPHRQRETTVAGGSKRRLGVFGRPAVDDGARHASDRLWPDRRCGGVAVVTRPRDAAGELRAEPVQRSLDQISHSSCCPWSSGCEFLHFGRLPDRICWLFIEARVVAPGRSGCMPRRSCRTGPCL